MNEEEIIKMEFINENIIEKGMDIEDLNSFISNKTGQSLDSLPLDKLKNILELYNNKDNENNNIT